MLRSQSLFEFLDNNTSLRKENCSLSSKSIVTYLNYLDNTKLNLLAGMSNTLDMILDYFTNLGVKCKNVKMKTRCIKVTVGKYR